jgi:adenylate cyclase
MSAAESIAGPERPPDLLRAAGWLALVVLPAAGLALVLAAPATDVKWEHHPAHFWLVLSSALTSAVLAFATGDTARHRGDARLFVVSLAFLGAAGFLGLHALATPGVLLETRTAGFVLATPVGLLVASGYAAMSATRLVEARASQIVARASVLRGGLVAVMLAWAALSLAEVGPLDDATPPESGSAALTVLALAGIGLYGLASARYGALYARLRAPILLAVVTAFGLIAVAARRQSPQERFSDLYLDETSAGKRDVSVVFADLCGFTTFSEGRDPREVSSMLNTAFERAIPAIRAEGGEIDRLVGDAIVATFNTRGDQPDHPRRAARAALDVLRAADAVGEGHPDWPRFRIGINSGEAMVGIVGAHEGKSYTVIGDTVNVAARLQGAAPVGAVAIGPGTLRGLPGAQVRALGPVALKSEPVDAYVLEALD